MIFKACLGAMFFVSITFLSALLEASERSEPTVAPDNSNLVEVSERPEEEVSDKAAKEDLKDQASKGEPKGYLFGDSKLNYFIYGFYSFANEMRFESLRATGAGVSVSGAASYGTAAAPGVGIEVSDSSLMSWGWNSGIMYDSKRSIDSFTASAGGVSVSGSYIGRRPTVSFITMYGNLLYRWNYFYLPFGLNFSIPEFRRGDGAVGEYSMVGAMGSQLGAGFYLLERLSIEFMIRSLSFKASSAASGYAYEYDEGHLRGGQINLKYGF